MKLNFKKIFLIVFFIQNTVFALNSNHGLDNSENYIIDATKNARLHSNMGNIYFEQKQYIGALKEYEIAYNLTADTNASSTYLYNIARCFIAMNKYDLAKNALLGAINKDCINITYYKTLVDCFVSLGIEQKELEASLSDNSNPYNRIIAGLIYLKTNKKSEAKMIFDEFVNDNPDMLITQDVRSILSKL